MNRFNKKHKSAFSPSVRNFLIGMGSVLNLAGNYYSKRYSKLVEERDTSILETAWKNVGKEIERGMVKLLKENPPLKSN